MKRNFITLVAVMVAAFFVGTELAHAADISFSGQIRTRYEAEDKEAMNTTNTSRNDVTASRVRLNLKTTINSDTAAFIQMQHVKNWGFENASFTGSNADDNLGLHQAYFTLKNVAGTGFNAKVGRQQVVIDGHRLFGHTGWTSGAQTHDGLRLTHSHDNMTMSYGFIANVESGGGGAGGNDDVRTHFLHTNFQGVLGGALSTYIVLVDDDCGRLSVTAGVCDNPGQWYTLGARQAGKMFGLDYRAEAYWQVGDTGNSGEVLGEQTITTFSTVPTVAGYASNGAEVNRDAYMFGVRVGKSFNNVAWKPKVTLWYDYLSGNDDESVEEGDWSAFDTLYDTGHKFYGFMDLLTNAVGRDTNYLGLQDIAIKLVLKPAAKWTIKADLHNFHLAHSVGANPDMAVMTGICTAKPYQENNNQGGSACRSGGSELGSELDLTLVHKYNPNVKLVAGYSQFMAEALWHSMIGSGNQDGTNGHDNTSEWFYVMADVKF